MFFFAFIALAVFGAVLWFQYRTRQKRRRTRRDSQSLGFQFSTADPERTTDLPFGLFQQGRRRGVENVMWGKHHDIPMRIFDYWYYDESPTAGVAGTAPYHRFTCAIARSRPRARVCGSVTKNFLPGSAITSGFKRRRARVRRLQPPRSA